MTITGLDHAAIPIEHVEEMLAFYDDLGFVVTRNSPFYSAHLGDSKINFHGPDIWRYGRFDLRGPTAVPGCGDFCFVWIGTQTELDALLTSHGIEVIEGPVDRTGGRGGGTRGVSTYVRDPDRNLLEFIIYPPDA